MAHRHKRYPEYNNSGIEWVGKIPKDWLVKPTFSVFDASTKKNTDGQESTVLSLSYGNIVERDVDTNFGLLPESFSTYQIVSSGDVILRLTDLQNDKKSLRVGFAKQEGIITSAYLKLKSKPAINSRFAYRLLHSYDTTKVFYGMGGGLRQSMKFEDFRRLPILLPPLDEQLKIADFLDYETAKIDTLIAKQEKLIELLKEKRQAVISHAITKGLNPNAPMKDSGVEWLGEVPEHWRISPLRRFMVKMEQGKSPECEVSKALPDHWGVLKTSCVNNGIFNEDENKALPPYIQPHSQYEVKAGDILMSRASGSIDLIGSVAKVKNTVREKILLSDKIFRIELSKDVSGDYFVFFMSSSFVRNLIAISISGAEGMANNITKKAILDFTFPLPPINEQNEIVYRIVKQLDIINRLNQSSLTALELLKEKKTSLISAAVTGKIDVRDWRSKQINAVK